MINLTESIEVKDLISLASPFIKATVETFVVPKIQTLCKRFDLDRKKYYVPTEEHFTEYLHRTYKKVSIVNTLVFNNSQRLLKDIYYPLTLRKNSEPFTKVKIETFPSALLNRYEKVLITDTAGMGKSTLMKTIFTQIIEEGIGIPLFIELRRLSKEKTILSEIHEQLNSIDKDFDYKFLLELLSEGGFILILDGFDEISLTERDIVTLDIQNFINKTSRNKFFITSRPEKALSSFGDFQEFKIDPLKKKEAFELLRKYDNQGTISTQLIKKLQETEMSNIEEFLINPLLVSLLFTAFEHKQAIPFKKYLFYRQVYDANFESHDLTKGESYTHEKNSKLEIDDFHRVLRHLGFVCFKLQKIEFTKDELLKHIQESKLFCVGLEFAISDFLQDLVSTVPLFTMDGNYYRWAHKSLQEYFAAQFIYLDSKEIQNAILERIYEHKNLETFINVLDLYYDMDYKTFRNVIERKLLQEYKMYTDSYLTKKYDFEDFNLVIKRTEVTFLTTPFIFATNDSLDKSPIDHNKLDKMLKTCTKKSNLSNGRFHAIFTEFEGEVHYYGLHYINTKMSLLNLLSNKKSKIVKKKNSIKHNCDTSQYILNLKPYQIILITSNPKLNYNSKNCFAITTQIIQNSNSYQYTLKHTLALSHLARIERELLYENSNNLLLSGI